VIIPEPDKNLAVKPGFHVSGKIPDGLGFYCFPTIPDFAPIFWDEWGQIWRIGSVSIFPMRPRSGSVHYIHTKNLAANLRLNQGFTTLHTQNLAVNLRLNRGFTILHTKSLAINLRPYQIHFEINDYPCNLIGSQWCDLFTNRTIFCSKSHLFLSQ